MCAYCSISIKLIRVRKGRESNNKMDEKKKTIEIDRDLYKNILDNLYDGVYMLDRDQNIIYWNKGAQRLTGYEASEVIGKRCSGNILLHADSKGVNLCLSELCPAQKVMKEGRFCEEEFYIHHKDGHRVQVLTRIAPVRDSRDEIIGVVEIFRDNSTAVIAEKRIERLQKMALLDQLTELGNRRYANINIHSRLQEMKRYGWPFGILFIDIDHFKMVNDTYSHETGDKVLKMVANTFSNSLRPFDTFSRWGGEEFVGVITNVNEAELLLIADRFRRLIEQSSFTIDSDAIRVTISMGATVAISDDTVDTILKRADKLMYKSKSQGANRVTIK